MKLFVVSHLFLSHIYSQTSMDILTTNECLFNSVLSTDDVRFMNIDIKDFYYKTLLEIFEYMQMPLKLMPQEIIAEYKLINLVINGNTFIEIQKVIPGIKQAGKIASDCLTTRL